MSPDEPPFCLTARGSYTWAQAAAIRAIDAGDIRARNRAWNTAGRFGTGLTLGELLEADREARALADGVTVRPLTEEQLRAMKRGAKVRDDRGRIWIKANTLWHRYASRSDPGERQPGYWMHHEYGPIWPVRGP